MGLDMYLKKHIYIGAEFEHRKINGIIKVRAGKKEIPVNFKKVSYIIEEVGYWRKANAIHNWFVKNVQNGVDECQEAYVDTEKLEELLKLCKDVRKDHRRAHKLLPCVEGFFFGSYDYDKYYFQDICQTIKILQDVLKSKDENGYIDGDIYYRASW